MEDRTGINMLESALYHQHNATSALMNGAVPPPPPDGFIVPPPAQVVQVMNQAEIEEKRDPALRLPRQIEHYGQIVGHFLAVKNSRQISRSMQAHFDRLTRYHRLLLTGGEVETAPEDA